MSTGGRLQAIYLRLEPASYKFLKSIRLKFNKPDSRPEHLCAIPNIFGLVHSQKKQLDGALRKLSLRFAPFSLHLKCPFRTRAHTLKAVHYGIESEAFNVFSKELRHEIRHCSVLQRTNGNHQFRTTRFEYLPLEPWFPKVPIKSRLSENAPDDLVKGLKAEYSDEPGRLVVAGLSVGPQRGRIGGRTATMDRSLLIDTPWRHFQLQAPNKITSTTIRDRDIEP